MSFKLTEKELVSLLRRDASLLITQPEGETGSEIESLRRVKMSDFLASLRGYGMLADTAAYPMVSASGSPVLIADGADNVPVKAMTVDIASQTGVTGLTLICAGKNLLPLTLEGIKAANTSGTWDGNTYTVTGVTHTVLTDADGNVTGIRVSGTPTGSRTLFKLCGYSAKYATVLSGCPAGGSANNYELQFNGTKRDFGAGASIAGDGSTGDVHIIIRPGYTANNLVFTPMIRLASVEDSTFEPFIGNVYAFDWTDTVGAITEGTLDVTNGILETGGEPHTVDPVEVRTLLGANTIYADCGDVNLTYRVDPTLYCGRVKSVSGKTGDVELDGGDVGFIPETGDYADGTIGKAVRTLEDDVLSIHTAIGKLEGAIIGDKMLVFLPNGSVAWEDAPV